MGSPAPNEALCTAITHDFTDFSVRFCDGFFFLKAAIDKAPVLTVDTMRAAIDGLGQGYDSPYTFSTRIGPERHDGAATVRSMAFVDQCGCFRYTGPSQSIS